MRRWFLILAATVLALGLAAAALLVWFATTPGFLSTDTYHTDAAEIAALAAADLGLDDLPDAVVAVSAREGGFQDRFVQIHLSATDAGFDRLLAELSLTRADLADDVDAYLGPEDGAPEAWPAAPVTALTVRLASPRLAHLDLAARPDPDAPGRWLIYLWGFEN